MKFEDVHKQATEDLKIDKFDLSGEALRGPNIFSKYLGLFRDEKLILRKYENEANILYLAKWEYYSGKASDDVYAEHPFDKKILRQDMDVYLNADQDIIASVDKIVAQKEKVAYLERVVKYTESRNYAISTALNFQKFTQGT